MKKQTLGMMISTLRKEHGMTQAGLAEKMSVTDKAVSKWERDLSCPDINSLPKLAEIFSISVDELMQVKESGERGDAKEKLGQIVTLILRAVAMAMGVAATVLSILDKAEPSSTVTMLGIGLSCLAITLIDQNGREE
ncbi:MAG TPA: helix-turn-helix transcriptional regulator [Candidatus Acidoferrum sp.]|nr:helix-turn-helix transcriptional regulator [Candidatus Acidoferrum sp.]